MSGDHTGGAYSAPLAGFKGDIPGGPKKTVPQF